MFDPSEPAACRIALSATAHTDLTVATASDEVELVNEDRTHITNWLHEMVFTTFLGTADSTLCLLGSKFRLHMAGGVM